jgi:hypothetical protein
LFIRLFGSLAVSALVSLAFIPFILEQNEFLRFPPSGWGLFSPGFPGFAALYEARPLAFKPPFSDLPSLRCHAGLFLPVAMFTPLKFVGGRAYPYLQSRALPPMQSPTRIETARLDDKSQY